MNDRRQSRLQVAGLLVAIALTLLSGALHGRMSQRWGAGERMERAIQQIDRVPAEFGNWQQEEALDLSKTTLELLSCRGYLHRSYRHRLTGEVVKVAVMVGPGAKMSIHVPEICYESSNFTLLGDRQRITLEEGRATNETREGEAEPDAFWGVSFQLNDVSQQRLEVAYGWSLGRSWLAPRLPRWTVGAAPVLYKLQASHVQDRVSATLAEAVAPAATNAGVAASDEMEAPVLREFLREFLPVLRESLVSEDVEAAGAEVAP